jgi:hypothetical protein
MSENQSLNTNVELIITDEKNNLINKLEELKEPTNLTDKLEELKEPNDLKIKKINNVLTLLSDIEILANDKFNKLLKNVEKPKLKQIIDLINSLSEKRKGRIPLFDIIDEIKNIYSDKKIELHEIPKLVSIIILEINKLNIKNIKVEDLSLLLKVLLILLNNNKIINLNEDNFEEIFNIVDESMVLVSIILKTDCVKRCVWCC